MSLLLLLKGGAGAAPVPPTPAYMPPPTTLSVAITTASGQIYRWGPDEWASADIPQAISFGTSMPGGFKSATITLPRRIDLEYPDLNLLDNVQILGPGNEIVWEGRVQQLPRSHQDTFSIQVGAVGWSAHLMDDSSFREIYIDIDISKWGEPPLAQKLALLGAQVYSDGCDISAASAPNGTQALTFAYSALRAIYRGGQLCYYGNGIDLGTLNFIFRGSGTDEAWTDVAALLTDLPGSVVGETGDFNANAGPVESGCAAAGPGAKYAIVCTWRLQGESTLDPYNGVHRWEAPVVRGNHGLTVHGGPSVPEWGLYASDVIADVVSRAAPLLNFSTGASGSIHPTTFAIPHLVFPEATTAQAVIMAVNGYHLWNWGVWEDKEFFFEEPDPDRLTWQARLSDGARLDLEGTQVDDVYNGVFVSYTDPGGKTHTVGPPGSGADATDASLVDTSPTNPVNAHGIPKKWALLNISQTTTQAGAIQLGAIYLGEKSLPQRRGTLTLTGTVTHPTAGLRPAWAVRAGDWVRIADHPTDVPRKIIETGYDASSQTITCTLDNTSQKVDAILERLGVSLMGVV